MAFIDVPLQVDEKDPVRPGSQPTLCLPDAEPMQTDVTDWGGFFSTAACRQVHCYHPLRQGLLLHGHTSCPVKGRVLLATPRCKNMSLMSHSGRQPFRGH